MKKITVTVDDQTYRRVRARAAQLNTTMSELVCGYLRDLAQQAERKPESESEKARRMQRLNKVIEDINKNHPDFDMAENLPRNELYDRRAIG